MTNDSLLQQLVENGDNGRVLSFLSAPTSLGPGTDGCGYDEGARIFFWRWGERISDEVKFDLGYSHIMMIPKSAQIFAAQLGRFSFILRPDWSKVELPNSERLRVGETLDGRVDVRSLGDEWALLSAVAFEEEEEQLWWAYEQALK